MRKTSKLAVCLLLLISTASILFLWRIVATQAVQVESNDSGDGGSAARFDLKMTELLTQGVAGNANSLKTIVMRCDEQLNQDNFCNLASAWKGTAIVIQSSLLFRKGNWQVGLEKWNEGFKLIEDADVKDASPLVKKRVASTCLGTWRFEQDEERKKAIAVRGLAALESFHDPGSDFWNRQPLESRKKWLSNAVAAAHATEESTVAESLLDSLGKLAPGSKEFRLAKDVLSGKTMANVIKPRFDVLVREDFFEGIFNDDQDAFTRAMKLCTDKLRQDANNYEAMVWLGSGRLHESVALKDDGHVNDSKSKWQEGLQLMHRACASAPDDINVLIPRAATLIGIGRIAELSESERTALIHLAVYDYEKTLELQKGYFENLSAHARGELLFGLADGWHQLSNKSKANKYFQRVIETVPDGEQAKLSKMFLTGKIDETVLANRNCAGCH